MTKYSYNKRTIGHRVSSHRFASFLIHTRIHFLVESLFFSLYITRTVYIITRAYATVYTPSKMFQMGRPRVYSCSSSLVELYIFLAVYNNHQHCYTHQPQPVSNGRKKVFDLKKTCGVLGCQNRL